MTEKDYEDEKNTFDDPVDERTEEQKVGDELYRMLVAEPDIEAINGAIGCGAFSGKEYYNGTWDAHIKACGKAIYDGDYAELGRLIIGRAEKYLKARALAKVNDW